MTAKQNLDNTYLVENESELPLDKLNPHINVGTVSYTHLPECGQADNRVDNSADDM